MGRDLLYLDQDSSMKQAYTVQSGFGVEPMAQEFTQEDGSSTTCTTSAQPMLPWALAWRKRAQLSRDSWLSSTY